MRYTFTLLIVLLLGWAVGYAVPQQINYQGYLTSSAGSALDTTVSMTFSLYTDSLAGSLLWTESRPAIAVQKGLFSSKFGEVTALTDAIFSNPSVWLGITVGSNSEMTPRTQLVSVAYSYRTGTVDGAEGGRINGDLTVGPTNSAEVTFRSFVAGDSNRIYSDYSTISGGQNNYTEANNTFIGGGRGNTITSNNAVIGGGESNVAEGTNSAIGGGESNQTNGSWSSVGGGFGNMAGSQYGSIGGGHGNLTTGVAGHVGGGENNQANSPYAAVAGGLSNVASDSGAFIGGGMANSADSVGNVIGGGAGNNTRGIYATIAGGSRNIASGLNSTVSGGRNNRARGQYTSVGGGGGASAADSNAASGHYSTVAGGRGNTAEDSATTVCGGRDNRATGEYATVAGGQDNYVDDAEWGVIGGGRNNRISIGYATVSGGQNNEGSGTYATIPGGFQNTAGAACFAAGRFAQADGFGSFVWSSGGDTTASFANNSFTARSPGGVRFYTSTSATNVGASLAAGSGTWTSLSDSTTKRRLGRVNGEEILRMVTELPIERWSYKTQSDSIQHIGPMAQDFHALFHVGEDDKTISTVDPSGIALAAIQELAKQNAELRKTNDKQSSEIAELKQLMQQMIQLGHK